MGVDFLLFIEFASLVVIAACLFMFGCIIADDIAPAIQRWISRRK